MRTVANDDGTSALEITGDAAGADGGVDLTRQLVRGLVRSRVRVFAWVLVGGLLGVGVGVAQPNRYESHARLALRSGLRERLTVDALLDAGEQSQVGAPTPADELQLLSERAIFERAALAIGPDFVLARASATRDDDERTPWPVRQLHALQDGIAERIDRITGADTSTGPHTAPMLASAAKVLRVNTRLESEPGTSVLFVTHTAHSPEAARVQLEALVAAFLERHASQYSVAALAVESRRLVEAARDELAAAAAALGSHAETSGRAELALEAPRLELELAELRTALFAAEVRREEITTACAALTERLLLEERGADEPRTPTLVPNEEYATQLELRRRLLAERQTLQIEERPSEETRRRTTELDAQLAAVGTALADTPKVVPQSIEQYENVERAAVQERLVDLELEAASLPVQIALLTTRNIEREAHLREVRADLRAAGVLGLELERAESAARARHTHREERAALLAALDASDPTLTSSLRVLEAPTFEPDKVGPRRLWLAMAGLFAGAFVGSALALLRQQREPRLWGPESLTSSRGVPTLARVPALAPLRRFDRPRTAARS